MPDQVKRCHHTTYRHDFAAVGSCMSVFAIVSASMGIRITTPADWLTLAAAAFAISLAAIFWPTRRP